MAKPGAEIDVVRVYDAPREEVWKAWTEPERIAQWWGKRGWRTPVESVTLDVRPGGVFRLNSIADADGAEMPLEAVFCEVVEPERLVFARDGREAVVELTDLGDGRTEMRFRTTIEAAAALRDRAVAGMNSAFDRLADHLQGARR